MVQRRTSHLGSTHLATELASAPRVEVPALMDTNVCPIWVESWPRWCIKSIPTSSSVFKTRHWRERTNRCATLIRYNAEAQLSISLSLTHTHTHTHTHTCTPFWHFAMGNILLSSVRRWRIVIPLLPSFQAPLTRLCNTHIFPFLPPVIWLLGFQEIYVALFSYSPSGRGQPSLYKPNTYMIRAEKSLHGVSREGLEAL